MEYLDLESFRSRYSDITVTAVPARQLQSDDPSGASGRVWPTPAGVEIAPITVSIAPVDKQCSQIMPQPQMQEQKQQNVPKQMKQQNVPKQMKQQNVPKQMKQQQQVQQQVMLQQPIQQQQQLPPSGWDALTYSNEYQQVLAKLEYTKYLQAQLQVMSNNNALNSRGLGELVYGLSDNNGQVPSTESSSQTNIVEAYDNLLAVIAEMRSNLNPTTIGLRAPKERLLRDIAHARVLVRECILTLMRDQSQEQAYKE